MILFWVLVILGVVSFIKRIASSNRTEGQKGTPEDILRKRYTYGAIKKEE